MAGGARSKWKTSCRPEIGNAIVEEKLMEFVKKNPWIVIATLLVALVAVGIATS